MSTATISSLLCISPETVQAIRKYYGLDKPGKMDEAVTILEDWIKMQRHFLKKNFNRNFLEMMIIQSKGSLERAKAQLDKYCTLKTMLPKYFEKTNPKTDFQAMMETFDAGFLSKFVGDYYRVYMVKTYNKNLTSTAISDYLRLTLVMTEYLLSEDYFNGYILVVDFRDFNMSDFLAALNLIEFSEVNKLYTESLGLRMKGFHFVTSSKMIDALVTLLRQFFSQKLVDRIYVHKDMDSLFKVFPKEAFPEDYGGKEKSLRTLRGDWLEVMATEKCQNFTQEMRGAITDEKCRDKYEFNSKYMGLPGTFRSLNVD